MMNKQKTQGKPVAEVSYPCYLSNHPKGADLLEGKSQERLAQAIAAHITETDQVGKPVFARLIGLQGQWGSGKSNVIKILEDDYLKDIYSFFYFDAWGNQEDLQRRSILELLTKDLITRTKLMGKTTMSVMKPEGEGKVVPVPCTWTEKLESLLSRKSYTRDITVPSLNNATKWFVLTLLTMGLVVAFLAVNQTDSWWVNILIALSPLLFFTGWMFKAGKSWKQMFAMYNTEGKSDTTSFVISEQEPSIREFKEWMQEVSDHLPEGEKLVVVFDNMDRLPSEKVHQFWSLIQTFFADDGYKNIWCIVPYDESHLASVFSDEDNEDKSIELLRRYLNKTFPVVYRVPEPIVDDYKNIFETYYREAFGTTIDDDSLELISQCYRHANPVPNVREIIHFINRNVLLAKQWKETINPISWGVYVLMEDAMLRNPKVASLNQGKKEFKSVSTDEYILSNEYYKGFSQILMGKVKRSTMQREMAAMAYGIAPENADQIVIKRYIRNCISGEIKDGSLVKYSEHPHFMQRLLEDVKSMSVAEYEKAALLIKDIDGAKLRPEDQKRLGKIWRFLGERYNLVDVAKENTRYEHILFSHVSEGQAKLCVTTFCQRLIDNKEVDGAHLYQELSAIFDEEFAESFDLSEVCPESVIEARRFADYVQEAGADYQRFPISTKPLELNTVIEETIDKDFPYLDVLARLKGDEKYLVSEVGDYSVQQLNQKKSSAMVAVHLIGIQRLFFDKFQSQLDANYITTLWQEVQTEQGKAAFDEIYALKCVGVYEQLPSEDRHINILMDKELFYTSTNKLISEYIANTGITFRGKLLRKMIIEKKHDSIPDYPEFILNWQSLVTGLGVSKEDVIQFADSWGYKNIPDETKTKLYFDILGEVAWIDSLLTVETPLSKALLTKCVADMSERPITKYIQANTVSHTNTNWDQALQKLVGTDYITTASFGMMTTIAVYLLDYVAQNGAFNDTTWETLLKKVDYATISTEVNDIRNNILNGQPGYTMNATKFRFLHEWLEQSGINTESHCSDAANQILAKVVDDEVCKNIILGKKEYYKPIFGNTVDKASALHDKLKKKIDAQDESDFIAYVKECVNYERQEEK